MEACLKARLNFFWRTGGVLGGSSLALPLKVIGSDSCILAADHLLWHSLGSNWRQQPRSHTCPGRHIPELAAYTGDSVACLFLPSFPGTLHASWILRAASSSKTSTLSSCEGWQIHAKCTEADELQNVLALIYSTFSPATCFARGP